MTIDDVINVDLITPYNVVIVVLILMLSTMALCLLAAPLGQVGGLTQVF